MERSKTRPPWRRSACSGSRVCSDRDMELGLGLIGIGREWGAGDRSVASQTQADELFRQALALNIGFFDTAPSYGQSEARLGRFLSELSSEQRKSVRVATKFGECWREGS